MSTVAIIPARGGSERIPRKNLQDLGGKPLIAWTIEAALAARLVDRVIVSTEDDEIAAAAQEWDAEVWRRPAALAEGHVPSRDVVRDVLQTDGSVSGALTVVLLHPTSPFRTAGDIEEALKMLWMWHGSVASFTNDELNGAIYAARADDFLRHGSFMRMPIKPLNLALPNGLDIDWPEDLKIARQIVAEAA